MNKFITKIISYFAISLCVLILINVLIWNVQSEKERFNKYEKNDLVLKYNFLNAELDIDKNQRIFFGTSKIYRHLNPILIDSLLSDDSKSYNFGHAGLFPFRLFDFAELFLTDNNISDQDVFIELTVPQKINQSNYNTFEILNSVSFRSSLVYLQEMELSGVKNILANIYVNRYSLFIYFKKYTLSGGLSINEFIPEIKLNKEFLKENRGYYPFYVDSSEDIREQRNDYLEGDSVIIKDIPSNKRILAIKDSKYIDYILNWLDKFEGSNLNFHFVITPRHTFNNLEYLRGLALTLADQGYPVIDLANSLNYPELYKHELSFDRGHLNKNGSYFFNLYLAEKIKSIKGP